MMGILQNCEIPIDQKLFMKRKDRRRQRQRNISPSLFDKKRAYFFFYLPLNQCG
jgi:hypothetical protein